MADGEENPATSGSKRKIDQVIESEIIEQEDSSSSSDEEDLFLPHAREILAEGKKESRRPRHIQPNVELLDPAKGDDDEDERNDGDENDDGEGEDTDGSDDWETTADADEVLDDPEEAEQFENENEVIGTEGDTLEDLAAGREEKEDDEIMAAFASAAQPQQRNKPRDIKCKFMITDLSFHPSEERIAISNIEGEIFVYKYSVEENELLHTLTHHKKSCRTLTFNDSGSLLFSASKDKSIVVTDMATMKPTHSILKSHSSAIYSMTCMDANVWASGDDDGCVKVWDLRRSTAIKPVVEFKEMDEFVSSMTTNSQARLLLCTSGDGTLTVFNTRARKMDAQSEVYPSEMNCVGLVRQETKVLTGMGNGQMYIFDWNAFGYHSDAFGDHPTGINAVLSVTDTHAVTGCDDGKIRAISLFPHRFLGVVGHHRFPVERLDISTCGRVVGSSSHDGVVRFWDIGYFEDPDAMAPSAAKKSARNKKRSLRKEKLGHQLPSSRRRNRGDFFAGLAEDEPAPSAQAEAAADQSDSDSSD